MQMSLFKVQKLTVPTIAIIDADLIFRPRHRFPNLSCMQVSAYYKQKGYKVELKMDYQCLEAYEKVFIAKEFMDTEIPFEQGSRYKKTERTIATYYKNNPLLKRTNVLYSGAGFFGNAISSLPSEIEHIMPDYHLYDTYVLQKIMCGANPAEFKYYTDYSIGYLSKGGNRKYRGTNSKHNSRSTKFADLSEFLDITRPKICLLDDNILACSDWKPLLLQLQESRKLFVFHKGLDERMLTADKFKTLSKSRYIGKIAFNFDNYKDRDNIIKKMNLIRGISHRECRFTLPCGYDPENIYTKSFYYRDLLELFERIHILMEHDMYCYVLRHISVYKSDYACVYSNVSRWCNQLSMYSKLSFREYLIKDNSKSSNTAMNIIQRDFPQLISQGYLDMKFMSLRHLAYQER